MKKRSLFFSLILFFAPMTFVNGVMPFDAKVYVAGHKGLVGSAIVRKLEDEGYTNIITRTSKELDLRLQVGRDISLLLAKLIFFRVFNFKRSTGIIFILFKDKSTASRYDFFLCVFRG